MIRNWPWPLVLIFFFSASIQAETFVCANAAAHKGEVIADGHCVRFVQECAKAPLASEWKQGEKVRGAAIPIGTAIATFKEGQYSNLNSGNHAAIYDGQDKNGIFVWDQWKGTPTHRRHIAFKEGAGSPSNDGDAYYVILKK